MRDTDKFYHRGKGEWSKYDIKEDKKKTGTLAPNKKAWSKEPYRYDLTGIDTKTSNDPSVKKSSQKRDIGSLAVALRLSKPTHRDTNKLSVDKQFPDAVKVVNNRNTYKSKSHGAEYTRRVMHVDDKLDFDAKHGLCLHTSWCDSTSHLKKINKDWSILYNDGRYSIVSKDGEKATIAVGYGKIIAKDIGGSNVSVDVPLSLVYKSQDEMSYMTTLSAADAYKKLFSDFAPYLIKEIKNIKMVYVARDTIKNRTYEIKDAMKKAGMQWSPNARVWYSETKPNWIYPGVIIEKMPSVAVVRK